MGRRKYGVGLIYLRGRTWWIAYSWRGTRYRESSRSDQRREATNLLHQRLAEIGSHGPAIRLAHHLVFGHLATAIHLDYRANGRRSLPRLESSLQHLCREFRATAVRDSRDGQVTHYEGGVSAADITTERIKAYVARRLAQRAAPATIHNELAHLKRAFNLLVLEGRLLRRPHIPGLSVENARQGLFRREDFLQVVAELPRQLRPLARFAYLTGWRKEECLGLQWSDVDFGSDVIRLPPERAKKPRGQGVSVRRHAGARTAASQSTGTCSRERSLGVPPER